jgi:hypothetical protein
MAIYSIETSSMCILNPLHLCLPLLVEGAVLLLCVHSLLHSAEEFHCPVYNRDVI